MSWRPARGFFEKARVALEEKDVEEEVKGQGPEVEKRCYKTPILFVNLISLNEYLLA